MVQLINKNESISKHFFFIGTTERMLVREWYNSLADQLYSEDEIWVIRERIDRFLEIVDEAILRVDYGFKLSTIEPSITKDGQLYFNEGSPVAVGISVGEWKKAAKRYAPEYNSRISTLYELFLWYAWRIAKGYWDLYTVCKDSSGLGNYLDAADASGCVEVSASRKVGGFCDGVGNTAKLVTCSEGNAIAGGMYITTGDNYPIADVGYYIMDDCISNIFSGVITLEC